MSGGTTAAATLFSSSMTLAQIKPEPKRDANDAGDIIPCPENTANDFTRQLNYERRYSPELEDILYWQIKHLQETGERLQEENQELQRLVASIPSASEFLKQYTSKNNNTDTLQQQQHLQRIPAQRTKLDRKQQRQQQRRQQQQQPQQRQQQSRTLLAVFLGFSFFSQVPFVKKSLTLNHSSCFQDDSADVSPSTTRSSKPGTNTININDTWLVYPVCTSIVAVSSKLLSQVNDQDYRCFPMYLPHRTAATSRSIRWQQARRWNWRCCWFSNGAANGETRTDTTRHLPSIMSNTERNNMLATVELLM